MVTGNRRWPASCARSLRLGAVVCWKRLPCPCAALLAREKAQREIAITVPVLVRICFVLTIIMIAVIIGIIIITAHIPKICLPFDILCQRLCAGQQGLSNGKCLGLVLHVACACAGLPPACAPLGTRRLQAYAQALATSETQPVHTLSRQPLPAGRQDSLQPHYEGSLLADPKAKPCSTAQHKAGNVGSGRNTVLNAFSGSSWPAWAWSAMRPQV